MEQQVAELSSFRDAHVQELLMLRFPTVPLAPPADFEAALLNCLERSGAKRLDEISISVMFQQGGGAVAAVRALRR